MGKGVALLNSISTAPWAHPRVLAWDAGLMTPAQLTEAESPVAAVHLLVSGAPRGQRGGEQPPRQSVPQCRGLQAGGGGTRREGWHRQSPGLRVTVQGPWPTGQPLWAVPSQPSRALPLLSQPPCSPGWAEGERRAGVQSGKNGGASLPQGQPRCKPRAGRGTRTWHQCAGQALEPHGAVFLGQSPA